MPPQHAALFRTPESLDGAVFRSFRLPGAAASVRLMLVGELDLVTARLADEAIRSAQDTTPTLICDLGDVWFVDISGLRVLLDAAARAKVIGGRLTVANSPPIVPRMLALLGLEHALDLRSAAAAA